VNRREARLARRDNLRRLEQDPEFQAQLEPLLERCQAIEDEWNAHLDECAQCDAAVDGSTDAEVRSRSCPTGQQLGDAMDAAAAAVAALYPAAGS